MRKETGQKKKRIGARASKRSIEVGKEYMTPSPDWHLIKHLRRRASINFLAA